MIETLALSGSGAGRRAPTDNGSARAIVGVVLAAERSRRGRLLDALEAAYPVRFEGRATNDWNGLDALVTFGEPDEAVATAGLPSLVFAADERPAGEVKNMALADDAALARPLRGARLSEAHVGLLTVPAAGSGDVVLATVEESPVWVRGGEIDVRRHCVAVAPEELGVGEALRNRLAPGRCLAVLALAQFVQDLTAGRRWELPAPRAAFIIDDPNLRWPTYGHVDYTKLAMSAAEHGYHVAMATVPLDSRPAHPRATRLFREHRSHLSLCIHGNDHDGPELGRPRSKAEGLMPVAQALRRVRAFERRTGVAVDRVMIAPHEQLSEGAAAALLACGYEACSGARPYPWIRGSQDLAWLTRPSDAGPLPCWGSAQLMPGGLPMLLRMDFGHAREELVIRAFLGQPLILCGHHEMLERGTSLLESMAEEINQLGDMRWCSLAQIARAAVETRRDGDVLELRMLARRVAFDVPAGIREVRVDATALGPSERTRVLVQGAEREGVAVRAAGEARLRTDHPGRVELVLDGALDPESVSAPVRRLRPVARRLATEARDRVRPVVHKL